MKIGVNVNDSLLENTFLHFWVAQTSHPSGSSVKKRLVYKKNYIFHSERCKSA